MKNERQTQQEYMERPAMSACRRCLHGRPLHVSKCSATRRNDVLALVEAQVDERASATSIYSLCVQYREESEGSEAAYWVRRSWGHSEGVDEYCCSGRVVPLVAEVAAVVAGQSSPAEWSHLWQSLQQLCGSACSSCGRE